MEIARQAAAAYQSERWGEASELYLDLVKRLPGSPGAHLGASRSLSRTGRQADALVHLERLVAFGVRFDPDDAAWDRLRNNAAFEKATARMRSRTAPLVRSTVALRLDPRLIPENIAWDPATGAFFVGSMYQAKIVRVAPGGEVSDFISPRRDGLLSVLGMKVDASRRELWAAAGNFGEHPPLEVPDAASVGKGALFRFHADTGALLGVYAVPAVEGEQPVQFNDLVVTPGGDVYATSGPRGVWRLRRDGKLEPFFSTDGGFFNGIALTPDGTTIFAASHLDGVFRIDVASGRAALLEVPDGVTLGGIDGLYVHDNSLVAIQNGTDPIRVVRAWLDRPMTRVIRFAVLEQGHPDSDLPLTGVIVGEDLHYVGRSQLRAFDGPAIWPAAKLKETTILRLPLDVAHAPAPDPDEEEASLLAMHRAEIRAHLERDAGWIAETHGEDFVSASGGKLQRSDPEQTLAFFTRYFDGAVYLQYEDAEPPVVRVSDDGSLGWVLSRTRVRRTQGGREHSFVYAGMMGYRKVDGRWIRVANASTFE